MILQVVNLILHMLHYLKGKRTNSNFTWNNHSAMLRKIVVTKILVNFPERISSKSVFSLFRAKKYTLLLKPSMLRYKSFLAKFPNYSKQLLLRTSMNGSSFNTQKFSMKILIWNFPKTVSFSDLNVLSCIKST